MSKKLSEMSVDELEALSYGLTAQRQAIRKQALAVQAQLGKKLEAQRVSQLLGRNVQIIDVPAIESVEKLGAASAESA